MARPTSITLLTGFLGAGKTTLLNRILRAEHERSIAVLVNDFGDVSIDAELIVSVAEDSVTLANGCICCTIKDDLVSAVRALLRRDTPPDQIVVETSGIAEPRTVLSTFRLMEQKWPLSIDAVVAVVDAEQFPDPNEPHYWLAREQIAVADVVLLNKADLCEPERLQLLRERIARYVPDARILRADHAGAPLELLIGVGSARTQPLLDPERAQEHSHPRPHAQAFSTFTYRQARPLSLERLRRTCTELSPSVYRAKGIVQLDARPDQRAILQVVGRRAALSLGEPWGETTPSTTIVCVGDASGVDAAAVARAFDACVAGPGERVKARLEQSVSFLRKLGGYFGKPKART